jgi:hypothetical protein
MDWPGSGLRLSLVLGYVEEKVLTELRNAAQQSSGKEETEIGVE